MVLAARRNDADELGSLDVCLRESEAACRMRSTCQQPPHQTTAELSKLNLLNFAE